MIRHATRCALVVGLCVSAVCAQTVSRTVNGSVHDQHGRAVAGALITVQGTAYTQSVKSADDGSFRVESVPQGEVTVAVDAPGFAHFVTVLPDGKSLLDITLSLALVSQEINVTANRVETGQMETAESVAVLPRSVLEDSATPAVDEALRQIPGFTLFRRSDSRTANPTSQGASLRGVGASGASRALVLYEDIPLNDPFGGWVYWGRIPREDVRSIEVLRGGGSSLYGSGALSGVVNVIPERPARSLFSSELSSGTEGTSDFSVSAARQIHQWSLGASSELFRTAGYIVVPSDQRGLVDSPSNSDHEAAQFTVRRTLTRGDTFASASFYNESRNNGTDLQTNDTQLWQLSGGLNLLTAPASIQLRGYGSGQSYNQSFSSIAPDRNSESLVRVQHVPAQQAGGSLTIFRTLWAGNSLVGGLDGRYVRGFSNETVFTASVPASLVSAGGVQLASGAFLQDSFRLHSRLLFTVGARYDNWDNYNARSRTTPLVVSVRPGFTDFADQSDHAFSPRVALLFSAGAHISLTASAYESFRAPTLNELYRSFRLGNVLTVANPQLQAERLSGVESGANFSSRRVRIHTAFFWMQVSDPVSNVTLSATPALITRQRENLGRTLSRGVEAEIAWHLDRIDVTAGYQFVDAVVTSFPASRALEGLELPQVSPHQFTFQTLYNMSRGWTVSVQGRASARQFDDDLNQLPLDSYFRCDTYIAKKLRKGVEVFGAVENLLNSRMEIARTPVVSLGPPVNARLGIKLRLE